MNVSSNNVSVCKFNITRVREVFVINYIAMMNIMSKYSCSWKTYLGEMERYSHLIHVTQNKLDDSAAALNDTKRRTKEMISLNEQINKTIQNIPASIPKTETSTNTEYGRWLPSRKTTSTRTTFHMVR